MRKHRNEGNKRELVTSAYFPYDSDDSVPMKEMRHLIDYCSSSRGKELIIGRDANADHIL
jgi:hypothetical protein